MQQYVAWWTILKSTVVTGRPQYDHNTDYEIIILYVLALKIENFSCPVYERIG